MIIYYNCDDLGCDFILYFSLTKHKPLCLESASLFVPSSVLH